VRTGFLGEDRVVREAAPDRRDHQVLGQVVRLGHDVAGALVVDPLELLVVVHQDPAGSRRGLDRERELGGPRRSRAARRVDRLGDRPVRDVP
jgi:hypothetical protein